jgi:adenylyltransferase/sulfurtransferase
MSLSKAELSRYSRHIKLNGVGISGQEKLKTAKVLVIGAGGLGCPVLQYLSAAGIGTIGILDGDTVDEGNLQRQVLFTQADIDAPKAKTAALKLKAQNPNINFKVANTNVTTENILSLIEDFDIIVDCTDNFPTRYLINDACILKNKPLVFGAIHQFEGQVSVFNYKNGPSYRCLCLEAPSGVPNCSEAGVIGVLPGIIGTIQANEVIKIILEIGEILTGKLLSLNTLNYEFSIIEFHKTEATNITALGTYDSICETVQLNLPKNITAEKLAEILQSDTKINILDVREYFEWDICHIKGASNIPMNLIDECINEVSKDIPTVVVCHHGVRSMNVIHYLEVKGYDKLINLEGGIHAWATQVDTEMATY